MQYSPLPCYPVPLRPEYPPQHPIIYILYIIILYIITTMLNFWKFFPAGDNLDYNVM
jgi:hypothetical protein